LIGNSGYDTAVQFVIRRFPLHGWLKPSRPDAPEHKRLSRVVDQRNRGWKCAIGKEQSWTANLTRLRQTRRLPRTRNLTPAMVGARNMSAFHSLLQKATSPFPTPARSPTGKNCRPHSRSSYADTQNPPIKKLSRLAARQPRNFGASAEFIGISQKNLATAFP
jgi:hypothetical protein